MGVLDEQQLRLLTCGLSKVVCEEEAVRLVRLAFRQVVPVLHPDDPVAALSLRLGVKVVNMLEGAGYRSIRAVLHARDLDMLDIRGFPFDTIGQIREIHEELWAMYRDKLSMPSPSSVRSTPEELRTLRREAKGGKLYIPRSLRRFRNS